MRNRYCRGFVCSIESEQPNDENISLSDYMNGLDNTTLRTFYDSRRSCAVNVTMPCFTFDCSTPVPVFVGIVNTVK